MLTFSANIEMLFPTIPFYDRFAISKTSGFDEVEFWSWENKDLQRIGELSKEYNLPISTISGDASDYALCDDSHMKGYIDYARASIEAAKKIGSPKIVLHSNALDEQGQVIDTYNEVPSYRLFMNMAKTLLALAPYAEKENIMCVVEPLNIHVDHVGNFLQSVDQGGHLIQVVNSPKIKVLYDMYHMHINNGNLIPNFYTWQEEIGHIHIADSPGRHEPGTGEINYHNICNELIKAQYRGVVAFELSPKNTYQEAVQAIMALPH
ncbi:MAG: TIM barrel protein [Sphaerochaetaceae bacterium]